MATKAEKLAVMTRVQLHYQNLLTAEEGLVRSLYFRERPKYEQDDIQAHILALQAFVKTLGEIRVDMVQKEEPDAGGPVG